MEKEKIKVNGSVLNFYDNKSTGDPVVFIHGNSLSALTYEKQFADKALQHYRLIAPDLPGHGDSGPATEPEQQYTLAGLTQTLIQWLEAMDIRNAVLVGHSLGGHMLMDAWPQIIDRAKALIIFGAPPIDIPPQMEHSHYEHPAFPLAFQEQLTNDQMKTLANSLVKKDTLPPNVILSGIKNTDPVMRPILGASTAEPNKLVNEVAVISQMAEPIAIFHGRYDQLIKHTYFDRLQIPTLWKGKAHLIDDAGHCPQLENPEAFNQNLLQFLNSHKQ